MIENWHQLSLKDDVVARGLFDWVIEADLHEVAARSGAGSPAARRALSIGLIAEILIEGLMVAGEISDSGFRQWDCSTADAIVRITEDRLEWGDEVPTPGAVFWLNLTKKGKRHAEDALRQLPGGGVDRRD